MTIVAIKLIIVAVVVSAKIVAGGHVNLNFDPHHHQQQAIEELQGYELAGQEHSVEEDSKPRSGYELLPGQELQHHHDVEDYYAHPKYTFKYGVNDYHTGDVKSQQESRDGDAVKGRYSLVEPDGSIRTVEYSADKHSGFNAVVHKTKPIKHYENEQANEKATGGQQLLTEHSHAHY